MKNSLKNLAFFIIFSLAILNQASARSSLLGNTNNAFDVTPLMSAVVDEDLSGTVFFSKSKAPFVNAKNIGGATALHLASRVGNYQIVKILVENEANVNAIDNEDWTPLMRATISQKPKIVNYLIDNNADASKLNSSSQSVIVLAANSSCIKCLEIILEKYDFKNKVKPRKLKMQIDQAYEIARNKENIQIQELLKKYSNYLLKKDENNIYQQDLAVKNNKKYSLHKEKAEVTKVEKVSPKVEDNIKSYSFKKIEDEKPEVKAEKKTKKAQKISKRFLIKKGKAKSELQTNNNKDIKITTKFTVKKAEEEHQQEIKEDAKQEAPKESDVPQIIDYKANLNVKKQQRKFLLFQGEGKKQYNIKIDQDVEKIIILDEKEEIISDTNIGDSAEIPEIKDERINNKKTSFRFIKPQEDEELPKSKDIQKRYKIKHEIEQENPNNTDEDKAKQKIKYILNKKYENDELLEEDELDDYDERYEDSREFEEDDYNDDYEDEIDIDDDYDSYDADFTTDNNSKRYLFIPNR